MNAKCSTAAAFTRSKSWSLNESLLSNLCTNFTFFPESEEKTECTLPTKWRFKTVTLR